jgi:hypothetical protein
LWSQGAGLMEFRLLLTTEWYLLLPLLAYVWGL